MGIFVSNPLRLPPSFTLCTIYPAADDTYFFFLSVSEAEHSRLAHLAEFGYKIDIRPTQ